MKLVRFGVSMEKDLLHAFDRSIEKKGYANRSEALRDLVRRFLVDVEREDPSTPAFAVISYVYDHERRELSGRLTHLGHSRLGEVISSMHVHLDKSHCLEVLVSKGTVKKLKEFADRIFLIRGVLSGDLALIPRSKL